MTSRYSDEELDRAAALADRKLGLVPKTAAAPLPPAPPIPIEPDMTSPDMETWWLPGPVGDWVEACHRAFAVPRSMAIAAALCSAAALVQGKARVQVRDGWEEPLSLYWLVFSPTGSRKSALLKAATAPVRAIQNRLQRELEPVIRERTRDRQRLERQIQKQLHKLKPTQGWTDEAQQERALLRKLQQELDDAVVPLVPRWLYDDINPTMVPRKLRHNQEAEGVARIAVLDAEGTFLANLLGRHSGQVNVDPLLKGYSGEPIDMVRAVHGKESTQDIHLDAAFITLLLMVQPHYLDEIRAQPSLGTNGFLGRCLMTHLDHSAQPVPWDAPAIPEAVQAGYAQWLADLSAIPAGTVWAMPKSVHQELRLLHERLERDRCDGQGAVGWTVRSLGRICRIIALTELGTVRTVSASEDARGEGARVRVISKITYLTNSLYSAHIAQARVVEPPLAPLPRLTRRALHWAQTVRQFKVGDVLSLRDLQRGLTVSKSAALELTDSLVNSGHLEQMAPTVRANKTLTVSYKILSLDPEPVERPKPILIPVSDPPPSSSPHASETPPDWLDLLDEGEP